MHGLLPIEAYIYSDMELGESVVAREIVGAHGASVFFSWAKSIHGRKEIGKTALQHFHRRVGIELPMKHFMVKSVKAGIQVFREGRYCEGERTEGATLPGSATTW